MALLFAVLGLGLMASLSPATIVVFILVLGTARARVNAAAFLLGWAASLTVVFGLSYLAGTSRSAQRGSGRVAVLIVEVLLGCAMVVVGIRRWRRRAEGSPASRNVDAVSGRLDHLGPAGSALVGVLKQPWAITAAAAVVVVHHHTRAVVALIAFAVFMVASTASVGLMYWYYSRSPDDANVYLTELRQRALAAAPALIAIAAMVIGAFLIVDGAAALTR